MSQLLIVDIQNSYKNHIAPHIINNLPDYAKKFDTIFYLFDTLGNSGEYYDEVCESWLDDEEFIGSLNIIKKEYGFFRNLMDVGIDEEEIVLVVQFMLENSVHDLRDLLEDDPKTYENFKIRFKNSDIINLNLNDYFIYIPDDLIEFLTNNISDNVVLVGGGEKECLKEVRILLDALKIKYSVNSEFVY